MARLCHALESLLPRPGVDSSWTLAGSTARPAYVVRNLEIGYVYRLAVTATSNPMDGKAIDVDFQSRIVHPASCWTSLSEASPLWSAIKPYKPSSKEIVCLFNMEPSPGTPSMSYAGTFANAAPHRGHGP